MAKHILFLFSASFLSLTLWFSSHPAFAQTSSCTNETAPKCENWHAGTAKIRTFQRDYYVYVPSSAPREKLPLVVMMHGCMQTAPEFAAVTRMAFIAEREKFIVLFPEQTISANPIRCWNWFDPRNQSRSGIETAMIVKMVQQMKAEYSINDKRIFTAGFSSGAAMVNNLMACYPDVFAAGGVHSGVQYKAAEHEIEAQSAMLIGSLTSPDRAGAQGFKCMPQIGKRYLPVIVFHGSRDVMVHTANADQTIHSFAQMNDFRDDGADNDSFSSTIFEEKRFVRPTGYAFSTLNYGAPGPAVLTKVMVENLGHAWSGGVDRYPFSDKEGPSASELMWQFFKSHPIL